MSAQAAAKTRKNIKLVSAEVSASTARSLAATQLPAAKMQTPSRQKSPGSE
jgi:hypothetical protein